MREGLGLDVTRGGDWGKREKGRETAQIVPTDELDKEKLGKPAGECKEVD